MRIKNKSPNTHKLSWCKMLWPTKLWQRILVVIVGLLVLNLIVLYAAGRWYIAHHSKEPLNIGVTFIPSYARYYELDPKQTLFAMLDELKIKHLRLVGYWDEIEQKPGQYNFDELDWQFKMAENSGAKVSLAIGLRQPRWPECHMPSWAAELPQTQWAPKLKDFMGQVIARYQNSPALDSYQLENEFFLKVFGICPDFSRSRLVDEFNFVKQLDSKHPVIIARSNNWIGLPLGQPRPDEFAISVYKRVWDKTFTHRYFEYPLPAWFYAGLAGEAELLTGKNMIIHELQAESWIAPGYEMNRVKDIPEQSKSLDAKRLKERFSYGEATGMRTIDMWGAEWWYWRKIKAGDSSLWDVAKQEIANSNNNY